MMLVLEELNNEHSDQDILLYFCSIKLGIYLLNKFYKQGNVLSTMW